MARLSEKQRPSLARCKSGRAVSRAEPELRWAIDYSGQTCRRVECAIARDIRRNASLLAFLEMQQREENSYGKKS